MLKPQNASYPIRPREDMPIEEQRRRLMTVPRLQVVTYYARTPHFFRVEFPDTDDYSGRDVRTLCAAALETDPESLRTT